MPFLHGVEKPLLHELNIRILRHLEVILTRHHRRQVFIWVHSLRVLLDNRKLRFEVRESAEWESWGAGDEFQELALIGEVEAGEDLDQVFVGWTTGVRYGFAQEYLLVP